MTKIAGPELNRSTNKILGKFSDQRPTTDLPCTWVWHTFHSALHNADPQADDGLLELVNSAWQVCTNCMIAEHEAEQHKIAYQQLKNRQANMRLQLHLPSNKLGKPDQQQPRTSSVETSSSKQLDSRPQDCNTKEFAHQIQKHLTCEHKLTSHGAKKNIHDIRLKRESAAAAVKETPQNIEPVLSKEMSSDDLQPTALKEQAELRIFTLGSFRVLHNNTPVKKLGNSKSKALFKYLLSNHNKKIFKEILMDTFWPMTDPAHAKNSLNVAIHGIRHALPESPTGDSYVLFENGCYFINPDVNVWIDSEQFEQYISEAKKLDQQGKEAEAIDNYLKASELYRGDFFEQDRYEDWIFQPAQEYRNSFARLTERLSEYFYRHEDYQACINQRKKLLEFDEGDERSHRDVMRCYLKMGQRHLAIRQFQMCSQALEKEFGLKPENKTIALYSQIKATQSQEPVGFGL